jgi:hypothetical protein
MENAKPIIVSKRSNQNNKRGLARVPKDEEEV